MAPRSTKPRKAPPRGATLRPTLQLTADEVAEREINVAIDLLLRGGDPVAIHVLTMAAYDVVEAAARRMKKRTVLEDHVATLPADERDGYLDVIRGPFNFMKHGGRAEELLADFMPDSVQLHLIAATTTFMDIYGREPARGPDLWGWVEVHELDIHAVAFPPQKKP